VLAAAAAQGSSEAAPSPGDKRAIQGSASTTAIMGLTGSKPPPLSPGGGAASGGGSGGGGGGGDDEKVSMTLKYDDVTWERDRRGNPVIIGRGAYGIVYAGVLHG